jgi:pSer/pThr/pTyr-binding forkhead associated (FHA) protein
MATGELLCPACGQSNAPGVRFCGQCGKRIDVPSAREPTASGPSPSAAGDAGGAVRTMFMHAQGEPATAEKMCKLITIDSSGREGRTFTVHSGETSCGRSNGAVLLDDPFVSPTHCQLHFGTDGKLKLIDNNSLNGVYLRVRSEHKLSHGDHVRAGRQLFRFELMQNAAHQVKKIEGDDAKIWGSPFPAAFGRVVQILDDGRTGEIRILAGERCQLGREIGDIVIPADGFISGRHCVFVRQGTDVMLQDLGSSNGTYVRVRGEAELHHGDFMLLGNQLLRVEIA